MSFLHNCLIMSFKCLFLFNSIGYISCYSTCFFIIYIR
nr:MAG TPA: hypothetical protein [Crassvirales sp.]DAO31342.1 MAG TPA: hypothetical protein [Crassvirales sp.]